MHLTVVEKRENIRLKKSENSEKVIDKIDNHIIIKIT